MTRTEPVPQKAPAEAAAFFFLVVFVVCMYTIPGEWLPALEPLRLALVSSALAAGLMIIRRFGMRRPVDLDGTRGVALILLGCLVAASVSWSIHPEATEDLVPDLWKTIAIYLALVNLVRTERRLAVLCLAFIFAAIVPSVGAIQVYRDGTDLVEGFRAHWKGTYADPNRMAMDLGIIVPLALAFIVRKKSSLLLRAACAAAAGLALTAMVISHSRGGFVGLCAAVVTWTLLERKPGRLALVAVLGLCMALFAPSSFWQRNETVADFHEDASAMGRIHAWTVAANANQERPLLGTGGSTFQTAWTLYGPPEAKKALAAHNVFLQALTELGWVGFALFLVFVGGGIGGAFTAARDPELMWLARGIAASLVGYFVCCLFAGFLASPHLYVLVAVGAAAQRLAASRTATQEEQAAPLPERTPERLLITG